MPRRHANASVAAEHRGIIESIALRNFLSFGPDGVSLPLGPLNVLVGPNGSGKSNLLSAFVLLRRLAASDDLRQGGVAELIWKGAPREPARIEVVTRETGESPSLQHSFDFAVEEHVFRVHDEQIRRSKSASDGRLYDWRDGKPVLRSLTAGPRKFRWKSPARFASVLSLIRDQELYPEISRLADGYKSIRLYRDWHFGQSSVVRQPQKADLRNDRLEEDFSNLGLFLNRLRRKPDIKESLLARLRDLYDGLTDFDVAVEGGTVQVFFTEGEFTIPASRLSDGSIRYLCLLAILCDPDPPPVTAIEEPELGMHPDLIPKIADLLFAASRRTQLIVTTHSDILIDALSAIPESVIICEKHDGRTEMRRLDAAELEPWLEKYRLGQLWTRGQLGGTRW